jgi:CHAT domain-containing protein/tetratricopeptide (TPR) repeat protein
LTPGQKAVPELDEAIAELGNCADEASLNRLLENRFDLIRPAVVLALGEAVRQRVRVDTGAAMRLASAALRIAIRLDDPESLGRASRAMANALWYKGQFKPAVEFFDKAVLHFEQVGLAAEIGRTISSSIQPLALLGEYDQALRAAEKARAIFRESGDEWRLARLEINVANVYHRQDRFAEALARYEAAYRQLPPHKDSEGMAVALHNMAVCLIALNDFDKALETYRGVRGICEENAMPLLSAQADYNISYLYFLRGDYANALEMLRQTQELCQRNGDVCHAALSDLDQSEIYIDLNLAVEAARVARRARVQFDKLGMGLEAGRSVANLAIAMSQQHKSLQALELFAEATRIFERENNDAWKALTAVYRAVTLFETGESGSAIRLCGEALSFFEASGLERRVSLCHVLLARFFYSTGKIGEAREHCDTALRNLGKVEAPLLSYQARVLLGHLQRAGGKPRLSYSSYRKAQSDLEMLRSGLQRDELKISFMADKLEVYESLVAHCIGGKRRNAAEEAFEYMEKAKSRSLAEIVSARGHLLSSESSDGTRDRIRALRQDLNWRYHRIEIEETNPDGVSAARIDNLWKEAHDLENEIVRLNREAPLRQDARALRSAASHMSLDEIRETLGKDSVLLEYFQVESDLVVAIVTDCDLTVRRVGPISGIASSIRALEFQMSKLRLSEFKKKPFSEFLLAATDHHLQDLYRQTLAPVVKALARPHLVIVPHGILHYLPFHALKDGDSSLIDRFSISYAPSAGIFALCHRRKANSSGRSLLLGISDKNAPWIRQEIGMVARAVPEPDVYMGPDATTEVLRTRGRSSRMIHIATHGIFRRDNPMFSSVRLADAYLNMYDLEQLELPVELFTLSGCGTGLSVVAAGDELLGLMRGLLFAGAESLLLTLWDVHDRTTAEFMSAFYSGLEENRDKASALRAAMLKIKSNHPHPYYWAPFVAVGKVSAA